jgi:hypothetical protein
MGVRVSDYLTMSALSALIAIHEGGEAARGGDDSPISASMYDRLERDKLIERWSPIPLDCASYVLTDAARRAIRVTVHYARATSPEAYRALADDHEARRIGLEAWRGHEHPRSLPGRSGHPACTRARSSRTAADMPPGAQPDAAQAATGTGSPGDIWAEIRRPCAPPRCHRRNIYAHQSRRLTRNRTSTLPARTNDCDGRTAS